MFVSSVSMAAEPYVYNQDAGRVNYMLQCQGCHKANGEGDGVGVPSMSEHGLAMLSIEQGRRFFISVPGSSLSPLSDQGLADALNYIAIELLHSAKRDQTFQQFDTSEVARHRGYKMKDVAGEREHIVKQIEQQTSAH